MEPLILTVAIVVGASIGFAAGTYLAQRRSDSAARLTRSRATELLVQAQAQQQELLHAAKEEAAQLRGAAEREERQQRSKQQRREQRLRQSEEQFEGRTTQLERREQALAAREPEVEKLRSDALAKAEQQRAELQRISGLTEDDAKEVLLKRMASEVQQEAARQARELEQHAREDAESRARRIIAEAIQRYAADQTVEVTQTVVPLPNEDIKGRIIGKEGRNIRALEQATGVDLIIDDTPEAVVLSSYDPVRREIARLALTKLVLDGRIHPTRIEELVGKARTEMDGQIREEGEKAAYDAGVHGLPVELVKTLGRLKFRTSYGQNVLQHSLEVSFLATAMAGEIGANSETCRLGGLLHDIGKAATQEIEGSHALIGAEMARRQNVHPKVVHAIESHHFEEEPETVEAFLVAAADAISASRPGARRESTEDYVKRLDALEEVANSFAGVQRSFALQAGREIRILVSPDDMDEYAAHRLASDIVKKIEESLSYPGQIRVTVIREVRFTEYAR